MNYNQLLWMIENRIFQYFLMEISASEMSEQLNHKDNPLKEESRQCILYEQVINKYFDIIRGILPKINNIYQENEQTVQNLISLESKVQKIETGQDNLHYQMRSNFLSAQSKINALASNVGNVCLENTKLNRQLQILNRQMREFKHWKSNQPIEQNLAKASSTQQIDKVQEIISNVQIQNKQVRQVEKKLEEKKKVITFQENISSQQKIFKKISMEVQCDDQNISLSERSRDNILLQNDDMDSLKMVNFTSRKNNGGMKSQKIILRKGTLKSNTKFPVKRNQTTIKSQKNLMSKDSKESNDIQFQKVTDILKEIQTYHNKNQIMKKNYEELMGQYCKINQEQFKKYDEQFKKVRTKIAELDHFHVHMQKIKLTLQSKINSVTKQFDRKIQAKVNKTDFNQCFSDINKRLAIFHEERKKVANKEQTKKALEFIDQKINHLYTSVQEHQSQSPKLHLVDLSINSLKRKSQLLRHGSNGQDKISRTVYQPRIAGQFPNEITKRSSDIKRPSSTIKRSGQSFQYFSKLQQRFNQQLSDYKQSSVQKTTDDTKTIRLNSNHKSKFSLLKDKSIQMLGKEKPKTRDKLKRQRMIFEYDR